jgi:hypothetical protein
MSPLREAVAKLLFMIPVLILVVVTNVLIAFSTSAVVFLQLITVGVNKHISLGAAILVAVGVHVYIVYHHKIRNHLKQGAKNE